MTSLSMTIHSYKKTVESYQVGNTVKVTYMRGDSEQTAEVTLQELAPQTDSDN